MHVSTVNDISMYYITIAIIVLTTIYYFYKKRGLPPGPTGLPYLGYWPFLKDDICHLQLHELGQKYGPVYSLTVTGRLYVNLGSHKALKEAHITKADCFVDRMEAFNPLERITRNSVVFMNGEKWKVNRTFFLHQFRERGVNSLGKVMGSLEGTINETVEEFHRKKGEPVHVAELLTIKCSQILLITVFGESINLPEIAELNRLYVNVLGVIYGKTILASGNVARYLVLPFMESYRKSMKYIVQMEAKMRKMVDDHKATFDEANIRNFIDAYLKEKKIRQAKNDPTAKHFTEDSLTGSLMQFIGDGVLTVAGFIASIFHTLLEHPEEQEKIYNELINVIGEDRDPIMDDKKNLPYTNAFITEVCRTTEVFPFFPKMECTKEVELCGYRIPKGALTIMNIWSTHHDPNEYEEPEKFNPSRFIPAEGKKKPELPILFGVGKRSCLGEGYVMAQVFLFMTTTIKHFRLTRAADAKNESVMSILENFRICVHPRKERK